MDAAAWDERYAGAELVWTEQPNQFVERETAQLVPGRVLDLACGEGRNAVWLAERGWRATGVDFSGVGLDKARQLAERRGVELDLEHADATTFTSDQPFDLVLVLYLQLPAAPRRQAIGRAIDAVGAGGQLLVVAHDRDNLEHGVGGPQDPAVLYDLDELRAQVEAAGLEVLVAEQARRAVMTPEGERVAIDTLLRARRGA
jgi:SAM-dependent methyltransferase